MPNETLADFHDRVPTLKIVAVPEHANRNGDIFGGWVMGQMDIACSMAAIERAKGVVATVGVDKLHFKKPIFIGSTLSFYTEVVRVGRTSITIKIEVMVKRPITHEEYMATEALYTFVAMDLMGNPRPVDDENFHLTDDPYGKVGGAVKR